MSYPVKGALRPEAEAVREAGRKMLAIAAEMDKATDYRSETINGFVADVSAAVDRPLEIVATNFLPAKDLWEYRALVTGATEDLRWQIADEESKAALERIPLRSDYDEHNTLNRAQQGLGGRGW